MANKGPVLLAIERRHLFQKVSVKQLEMAVSDPAYESEVWQEEFGDMLAAHAKVATPSQIVEDCFVAMKTAKVLKGTNRIRRVERSMFMPLREETITQRHAWETPNTMVPVGVRSSKVDESVWEERKSERTCFVFLVS